MSSHGRTNRRYTEYGGFRCRRLCPQPSGRTMLLEARSGNHSWCLHVSTSRACSQGQLLLYEAANCALARDSFRTLHYGCYHESALVTESKGNRAGNVVVVDSTFPQEIIPTSRVPVFCFGPRTDLIHKSKAKFKYYTLIFRNVVLNFLRLRHEDAENASRR